MKGGGRFYPLTLLNYEGVMKPKKRRNYYSLYTSFFIIKLLSLLTFRVTLLGVNGLDKIIG